MPRQAQPQSSTTQIARKLRHIHHLGSIIDAQGREVPITEQMILQACRQLERESLQQHRCA